jgi:Lon protease-like protein
MKEFLLPLFPLNVVLLPQELLPLHIFEERYKEMVGACLKAKNEVAGNQEFGIVQVEGDKVHMIGCTARIVNVTRRYEDGRLDILTMGARRFEVLLTNEEQSYLQGGVDFFDDEPGADTAAEPESLRAIGLFRDALQHLRKTKEIPVHMPPPYRHLSFRIAGSLPLELSFKQDLLVTRNESRRLERVTQMMERLIAHVARVERIQRRAGGNGHSVN